MKLVASKLCGRVMAARLSDWPRILPTKHRAAPTGAGFGSSRYSSPTVSFRVLYAAENFSTAFAEAVVRDRFEGKSHRYLYRPHLEQVCLTAISSSRDLKLLDLRGAAAYELGVDTDSSRARDHAVGQALSQAVHDQMADVDGILFDSRLTTGACVAIYDRAFSVLSAAVPISLLQTALLPAEITRLGVTLRRERGYKP